MDVRKFYPGVRSYDSQGSEYKSSDMVLVLNPVSGDSDLQDMYDQYMGEGSEGPYQEESTASVSYMQMQPRSEIPYKPMEDEEAE